MATARYAIVQYDDGTSLVFSDSPDDIGEVSFPTDLRAECNEAWAAARPAPTPTPTTPTPPPPASPLVISPTVTFAAGAAVAVYVNSASGKDGNTGTTPAAPLKSIGAGLRLLKGLVPAGKVPVLALARGCRWTPGSTISDIPDNAVIAAWGDSGSLPVIGVAADQPALMLVDRTNVVLADLSICPSAEFAGVPDGGVFIKGGKNIRLAGCRLRMFRVNLTAMESDKGRVDGLTIERCVLSEAFSRGGDTRGHSQGGFVTNTDGLVVTESFIYRNGYREGPDNASPPTIFNHGLYCYGTCGPVTIKGNVFASNSSHGLQAQAGGDVTDNVFIDNGVAMSHGLIEGDAPVVPGGVTGSVSRNVIIGGRDIGKEQRGIGVQVANSKNVVIVSNLFIGQLRPGSYAAISLEICGPGKNADASVGLVKLAVRGNRCIGWTPGLSVEDGLSAKAKGKAALGKVSVETGGLGATRGDTSGLKMSPGTAFGGQAVATLPLVAYAVEAGLANTATGLPSADVVVAGKAVDMNRFAWQPRYTGVAMSAWLLGKNGVG